MPSIGRSEVIWKLNKNGFDRPLQRMSVLQDFKWNLNLDQELKTVDIGKRQNTRVWDSLSQLLWKQKEEGQDHPHTKWMDEYRYYERIFALDS